MRHFEIVLQMKLLLQLAVKARKQCRLSLWSKIGLKIFGYAFRETKKSCELANM